MKRFLGYIYEYRQGKRSRNVGFARIEEEMGTIRGLIAMQGMQGKKRLDLHWIYEEDKEGKRKFFQSFDIRMPSVNIRIECREGDGKTPNNIVGVYLEDDGGDTYAVCWKTVEFSFVDIREEEKEINLPKEEEDRVQEETESKETELKETDTKELPSEETLDEELPKIEEEKISGQEEKSDIQTENEERALNPGETQCDEVLVESDKEKEEEVSSCEAAQCDEEEETRPVRIEKIQREEIAKLPRCEWRLANNHFLIHGWRNYHYLVLIEDDGKLFLGVPGIYHKREADAALAFGFPEFRSASEDGQDEDFGYWCRQVRGSIMK